MKTLDVWSDIACPWCYVGKRRLERALAEFDERVEVRWRAYLLQPDVPPDSQVTPRVYLEHRYGDATRVDQMWQVLREHGAPDGIAFDFEAQPRMVDTRPLHRLIKLAPAQQRDALIDALFSANFEHGVDMGSIAAVAEFVRRRGVDLHADVWERHEHGGGADEVEADLVLAQRLGVQGVPFFLTGRKAISGAQQPDVFLQLLEQADEPIAELA